MEGMEGIYKIENELREIGESLVAIGILLASDRLSTAVDDAYLLKDPDGIMDIHDRLTCTSPLLKEVIIRRTPSVGESIQVKTEEEQDEIDLDSLSEEDRMMAQFMGLVDSKKPWRQWQEHRDKLPEHLPKTEGKEKNIPTRKGWNPFKKDDSI